jgi:hypothetical protein
MGRVACHAKGTKARREQGLIDGRMGRVACHAKGTKARREQGLIDGRMKLGLESRRRPAAETRKDFPLVFSHYACCISSQNTLNYLSE